MSAPTAPINPLNNIRRGELKRLLLHRGTSEVEVHNLVEDIIGGRARWTAPALGSRMNLTFDEQIRLGIRTIACIDRTKWMMRLYFRERKRERDRMRWHRKKQTFGRGLSPMAKQIAELPAGKWMRVAEVVEILRRPPHRKREAARSAVRRALRELIAAGLLEDNMVDRPTGDSSASCGSKGPKMQHFLIARSAISLSLLIVSVKRAIRLLRLTKEVQRNRAQLVRCLLQKTPLAL